MDEKFEKFQDMKWDALKAVVNRLQKGVKISWDDEDVKNLGNQSFDTEKVFMELIEGRKQDDEEECEILTNKLIEAVLYEIRGQLLEYNIKNDVDFDEVEFHTQTEFLIDTVINMGF